MSNHIPDCLELLGVEYAIDAYPLDPLLASLAERPVLPPTIWRQNGYVAKWAIADGMLVLTQVSRESLARLFAGVPGPVPATWFSGFIRGWRGERRRTGYPPRCFFDEEVVLELVAGAVVREWALDLRGVRDQTDEELRLSLPSFLWPARLRGNPD
jgi:hypothetical protein